MADYPVARDKPWRPGDHPRPGPSWDDGNDIESSEHKGVPDAED
jgi:hypothetical protein